MLYRLMSGGCGRHCMPSWVKHICTSLTYNPPCLPGALLLLACLAREPCWPVETTYILYHLVASKYVADYRAHWDTDPW
jgi:hypothetical protein